MRVFHVWAAVLCLAATATAGRAQVTVSGGRSEGGSNLGQASSFMSGVRPGGGFSYRLPDGTVVDQAGFERNQRRNAERMQAGMAARGQSNPGTSARSAAPPSRYDRFSAFLSRMNPFSASAPAAAVVPTEYSQGSTPRFGQVLNPLSMTIR